jgi:enolase
MRVYALNTSGEGSYSPHGTSDPRDAFEIITRAIEEKGYQDDFVLYLDAASTHLYDRQTSRYRYRGEMISREQLFEVYQDLQTKNVYAKYNALPKAKKVYRSDNVRTMSRRTIKEFLRTEGLCGTN